MRHILPPEALPVQKGQVWRDRDRRSPTTVKILSVQEPWYGNSVTYDRGVVITQSRYDRFIKKFDFVSNPVE